MTVQKSIQRCFAGVVHSLDAIEVNSEWYVQGILFGRRNV